MNLDETRKGNNFCSTTNDTYQNDHIFPHSQKHRVKMNEDIFLYILTFHLIQIVGLLSFQF